MSKQSSLVTVLISIRNGESTLNRCLESLRNQTFKDFAIVCVNDHSTDKTKKMLENFKEYFQPEQFIILENEVNLGLTKSLNSGLEIISSKYTARIDVDDWWHPEKLEKQISFLESHPDYDIVGCNYINVSKKKRREIRLPQDDAHLKRNIIKRNPFAHSCVVFRTALIKNLGGYDESVRYGQDYELWLRISPKTKFYNIQEMLCFRSIEGGISVEKQRAQMLQGVRTQIKYVRKYHLPFGEYRHIAELILLIVTPDIIKRIKRRFFL